MWHKNIQLKQSRTYRRFMARDDSKDIEAWDEAPAFAVNPRGILIHRVRNVTSFFRDGKDSHHHVDYLCNNGCNVDADLIFDVLTHDPPTDRLLCQHCEARAEIEEKPSSDKLAGRHVHRGVLVAKQVCCQ